MGRSVHDSRGKGSTLLPLTRIYRVGSGSSTTFRLGVEGVDVFQLVSHFCLYASLSFCLHSWFPGFLSRFCLPWVLTPSSPPVGVPCEREGRGRSGLGLYSGPGRSQGLAWS